MKYIKPIYYNTLTPYKLHKHHTIQYTVCREFKHISRYRCLRQIVHNYNTESRFISLETTNPITTNLQFVYYDVKYDEQNRLDLIANRFYGSAQYSWVISYLNGIEDGYTVYPGQRLRLIKNITDLFNSGEILAPIPVMQLNLGVE